MIKTKVLIGTTNPSKVKRFEQLLAGCDKDFHGIRWLFYYYAELKETY